MPTLPGRATSILAVLGGFSPSGRRATWRFDWPALVAEARPGDASEAQRQQALRYSHVHDDLTSWVHTHALSSDHLEECALYSTVSTPAWMAHAHAMTVAHTIYWIYAIDDFIDQPGSVAAAALEPPAGGPEAGVHLDRDLATILAPLSLRARRSYRRAGLAQTHPHARLPHASPRVEAVRDSLGSLFSELQAQWEPLPGVCGGGRFRLRLAAEHMITCVAMMRQERHWNSAAANRPLAPPLPTFRTYLRAGTNSIGMPAVASAVSGFEPHPRHRWRTAWRAIVAAGRIVRLANDLHTYEADVDEGKVSAITIRLRDLGCAPFGHDPRTSREVRQAQAWVSNDLAHGIADFSRLHTALPPGPLSYYLRHVVAFALAVYGDGSRFAANPVAAPS